MKMKTEELLKKLKNSQDIQKPKDNNIYYGKLEDHFKEICKVKSLNEEDLKHQMIKDFVETNKKLVSQKYYLKYYGDDEEILVYGDDGEYFELSDGSRINKRIFEKMFKNEKSGDIEINPHDFWNYNAIDFKSTFGNKKVKPKKQKFPKEPITPIDAEEFNEININFVDKLEDFFAKIDTSKLKYRDDKKKKKK